MHTGSQSSKRQKRQRRRKPALALTLIRLAFSKLGPIFPSLFGAWAYRIWFSTRRFKAPRREQAWLENANSEAIELAGIPVMTYQWGDKSAPLVVLVHGWNGRGSQMAAFAEPLVRAGFRVLSYDAPGHGQTPGNSTNIFILSNVLKAIADKVAPIHGVVGHSFGGMTASLALSQGMVAKRAVLLSTPAQVKLLIDLFAAGLRIPGSVEKNLIKRLQLRFGENLLEDISTADTCQQLGHVPALIIHDENDEDVPVAQAEQIHRAWQGSELMTTRGLGHKRVLYNAGVIEAVKRFVSENNYP